MKPLKPFAWVALALLAAALFAAPSAQAGTRVSINIGGFGGGYCQPAYYPRPVAYCPPRPYYGYGQPVYYSQPVYYRPAYYPAPRAYYPAPGYRSYPNGYGNSRAVYYR